MDIFVSADKPIHDGNNIDGYRVLYIRSYIERKMNNGKQAAKAESKSAEQAATTAAGSARTATAAEQAKITFLFRHKRRCDMPALKSVFTILT